VGTLTAIALALRGATVYGLDIVEPDNLRVRLLEQVGGVYVGGAGNAWRDRAYDMVFDASGVAKVEFDLLGALAPNAIYAVLGIPGGVQKLDIDGAQVMRRLVLGNQVVLGSVNASIDDFRAAVAGLCAAEERWPGAVRSIITERVPVSEYARALEQPPDELKTVVHWSDPRET
jgi:threonine dehydrogenase-like Zn-dependent dehydrogenase